MAPIPAGYVSIARQRSMELKKPPPPQPQPSSNKYTTAKNNAALGRRTGEDDEGCKTPKSKQYRLPDEAAVCPPTPMKPRCGRRIFPPPNGFFTSPELDRFFNQLDF